MRGRALFAAGVALTVLILAVVCGEGGSRVRATELSGENGRQLQGSQGRDSSKWGRDAGALWSWAKRPPSSFVAAQAVHQQSKLRAETRHEARQQLLDQGFVVPMPEALAKAAERSRRRDMMPRRGHGGTPDARAEASHPASASNPLHYHPRWTPPEKPSNEGGDVVGVGGAAADSARGAAMAMPAAAGGTPSGGSNTPSRGSSTGTGLLGGYFSSIWGNRKPGRAETDTPYAGETGVRLRTLSQRPREAQARVQQLFDAQQQTQARQYGAGGGADAKQVRHAEERHRVGGGAFRFEDPTQEEIIEDDPTSVGDGISAAGHGAGAGEMRRGEGWEEGNKEHYAPPSRGGAVRGGLQHQHGYYSGGGAGSRMPDVTREGYFGDVWGRRNVGGGQSAPYMAATGVRLRGLTDGDRAEREREAVRMGYRGGLVAARGVADVAGREGLRDRPGSRLPGGVMGGISYLKDVFGLGEGRY